MRINELCGAAAVLAFLATPAFAETQNFNLSGFKRVAASAGTSVNVTVGADYSVTAQSTSEGLEKLRVEVKGDELQIGRKRNMRSWGKGAEMTITVTMPALEAASVSSGADIDITGVDAGAFSLSASSGGSLDIAGRCDALSVSVSSGGDIDAEKLECRSGSATASSGGSAEIFASESVNGSASSGGSVDVYGAPKTVNKNTSSGGSVDVK